MRIDACQHTVIVIRYIRPGHRFEKSFRITIVLHKHTGQCPDEPASTQDTHRRDCSQVLQQALQGVIKRIGKLRVLALALFTASKYAYSRISRDIPDRP
jgi:hypothetical protein